MRPLGLTVSGVHSGWVLVWDSPSCGGSQNCFAGRECAFWASRQALCTLGGCHFATVRAVGAARIALQVGMHILGLTVSAVPCECALFPCKSKLWGQPELRLREGMRILGLTVSGVHSGRVLVRDSPSCGEARIALQGGHAHSGPHGKRCAQHMGAGVDIARFYAAGDVCRYCQRPETTLDAVMGYLRAALECSYMCHPLMHASCGSDCQTFPQCAACYHILCGAHLPQSDTHAPCVKSSLLPFLAGSALLGILGTAWQLAPSCQAVLPGPHLPHTKSTASSLWWFVWA